MSNPSETTQPAHRCAHCDVEYDEGDSCPACGVLREPVPCDDDPSRTARYRCVICGRTVCGDDDVEGAARCADHATVSVTEGWSQVYAASDEIEAGLIVDNLRAEGIDAQVFSHKDDTFPVDRGVRNVVRVLVPVWEHADASQLIQSYMDREGEVGFACPGCGEVHEPGATRCEACGADLPAG